MRFKTTSHKTVRQDSPAAAYEVAHSITTRTENGLSHTALMGRPGRTADTRELVFADLPYIVVYRVTSQVEVIAVVHTARDWPERFE